MAKTLILLLLRTTSVKNDDYDDAIVGKESESAVFDVVCYFPTMKMNSRFTGDVDDMYNVHGHAGNLCREAVLEGLGRIVNSRLENMATEPVTIADFGTADGRASLSLINEIIEFIQKELGQKQAVVVYYNDQPMDDFNLLSKVISGYTQNPGLTFIGNVYPVMIPRTMYEQCLPDNSIDLAISTVATHYLSKQVCKIKNGVFMEEADDEEQERMREQGKADWRDFVISRGRELKPGGFLVTMNTSSCDNEVSAAFENGNRPLGSILSDMATEGIITQDEYLATNYNAHCWRQTEDFQEPFASAVPEIEELGLELVSVRLIKRCQQHPIFDIVNKDFTDKLKFSQRIVAMVYPWFHHVIYRGLADSRTEDEKEMITDQYFQRMQKYAFEHSDFKPYLIFTEVVIKRNM
ncbi:methyltransferase FUS9-like [Pecten maximus]|uniref:methyltransferase FUS9-like n=1 Tax=Pecten maximus TaxID=6579 RepID=UPI001458748D|nr:methyltransferase FUS9-like [Pecten maximus]